MSAAVLQAAGSDQEQFTISNAKDVSARRLLRNAVVQLYDGHDNPAAAGGVPVRWRLYCTDADCVRRGAEAPQLCVATGELQLQSNDKGRAFFGDVGVEQGTGKMVRRRWLAVVRKGAALPLSEVLPSMSYYPAVLEYDTVNKKGQQDIVGGCTKRLLLAATCREVCHVCLHDDLYTYVGDCDPVCDRKYRLLY